MPGSGNRTCHQSRACRSAGMTAFVLPLDSSDATLSRVGGKGANLSRLMRAGFPVPPGFLITTSAYHAFVKAYDLHAQIVAMATDKTTTPDEASAAIRQLFELDDPLMKPQTVDGSVKP